METLKNFFRVGRQETLAAISAAVLMATALETEAQASQLRNEQGAVMPVRIETRQDQNMPEGFRRDQVIGLENGQETVAASLFWFDDAKTHTQFVTKQKNPNAFMPEINYETISNEVEKNGTESVIAFAGAYESGTAHGSIEGVAIQDGSNVGSQNYSKSGFVYMTPTGKMELHRVKNDQTGKFDTLAADALVNRAKSERASLFQQIPAIWDGIEKLNTTNPAKFEWRAICQTRDGKKFVLNCSEKITLRDFLIFALNLKDPQTGQLLVDDLMMTDTGAYSYGMFRDKNQIADTSRFSANVMIDENYGTNKTGYTNAVVIGVRK